MSGFIVIEGIDGCGSTTQAQRLVAALARRGHDARLTREPSDGPVGGLIRQVLERRLEARPEGLSWAGMALLFAADRLDHVDAEIEPALSAGAIVVSDRYDLSSLAYQSVTSTERDAVAWIRQLNRRARRPDLTIVIDVAPEIAERRRAERGGAEELFEKRELQRRLAEVYRDAERLVPDDRLVHISGDGSPEQIEAQVLAAVDQAAIS